MIYSTASHALGYERFTKTDHGDGRRLRRSLGQRLAQPGPHRDRRPVLGFITTGGGGIEFLAKDDVLFKLVPVNNEDNVLHLILGITGVIAYFASRPFGRTATA